MTTPQQKLHEGLALHQQGQLQPAQTCYQAVLTLDPSNFDALRLLGDIAIQRGDFAQAGAWLEKAGAINPDSVPVQWNRANVLRMLGQLDAAVEAYSQAIKLKPDFVEAYANRGVTLNDMRQHQAAIDSYDKALAFRNDALIQNNRGIALFELKRAEEALASYDNAIALQPDLAIAHCNRAAALTVLGRCHDAIASCDRAIQLNPDLVEAFNNRGLALNGLGKTAQALESFNEAIRKNPQYADGYNSRGSIKAAAHLYREALVDYDAAIALRPAFSSAYNNRGNALRALRDFGAAVASFNAAHAINPNDPDVYSNCAATLLELNEYAAAIELSDKALQINPHHAEALVTRGDSRYHLNDFVGAASDFDKAFSLKPNIPFLSGLLLNAKLHICDWQTFEACRNDILHQIEADSAVFSPFGLLAAVESAHLQYQAAKRFISVRYPEVAAYESASKTEKPQKIKLGYFSADFRIHAVSTMIAQLIEMHDREAFEIYAFSYSGADDAMRTRLKEAFDHFIDTHDQTDDAVVAQARDLGIDIAIDLGGHTGTPRTAVFAKRAAPVQVNYLGYPGTMGASFIDYIIADDTVIPEASRTFYSEKVVTLPCFQVNDSAREIADRTYTRAELGLPPTGFVYCCLNNSYKITPSIYDIWMRILSATAGSALYLLAENDTTAAHLRKEAERRGIDRQRIVFASRLPQAEYLARYRAMDLFLDTAPFNAGATGSGALWAGLPILTYSGETFASRMGASMLNAVGLTECIADSPADYERKAIQFATHPEQLAALKQKLAENKDKALLFDTGTFTRHIEDAYRQMVGRSHAGLPPEHLSSR